MTRRSELQAQNYRHDKISNMNKINFMSKTFISIITFLLILMVVISYLYFSPFSGDSSNGGMQLFGN